MLWRRFFSSDNTSYLKQQVQWPMIKQVTKSNFPESVKQLKNQISNSDFIAVSLQNTGSYSSPWHRILPFDTSETAYLKAKYAADKFQILQFAVCPFSLGASSNKLIPHPFNFHLFPRDEHELKIGMPCYSFSCQPSYLASMARQDFDFNACIYHGISYLSRAQESTVKSQIGNPVSSGFVAQSRSVADNVFVERIKSRVGHWISACKRSRTKTSEDALVSSLRKLVLGGEDYGSRPSLNIDVCSERQVQLVFEMVNSHYENVVPLTISAKGGGTQSVRVILTSSKEDRGLLEKELQNVEEEQSKRVRGFREVIDLISTSLKPVITHNALHDFTFIHSKFLSPLPPTMEEFRSSLRSAFPDILDVNHLMKEVSPLNKYTNLPAAISYLKRNFFAPIEIEISQKAGMEEIRNHGHNVVRISELFAKLCFILKIDPEAERHNPNGPLKRHSNVFNLNSNCNDCKDIGVWTRNPTKISINNLVFLWGFRSGISAGNLKKLLGKAHNMLSQDHVFDVRLVDKSCAVVVFWKNGVSEWFVSAIASGDGLGELVAEGMMAAGYEAYKRVCKSEILGADLADSLTEFDRVSEDHMVESAEVYWNNELMINFDDL